MASLILTTHRSPQSGPDAIDIPFRLSPSLSLSLSLYLSHSLSQPLSLALFASRACSAPSSADPSFTYRANNTPNITTVSWDDTVIALPAARISSSRLCHLSLLYPRTDGRTLANINCAAVFCLRRAPFVEDNRAIAVAQTVSIPLKRRLCRSAPSEVSNLNCGENYGLLLPPPPLSKDLLC